MGFAQMFDSDDDLELGEQVEAYDHRNAKINQVLEAMINAHIDQHQNI